MELSEIKLKPCPFCGGKAYLIDYDESDKYFPEDNPDELDCAVETTAECDYCGAMISLFETPRKAVEAWNRRAADE